MTHDVALHHNKNAHGRWRWTIWYDDGTVDHAETRRQALGKIKKRHEDMALVNLIEEEV